MSDFEHSPLGAYAPDQEMWKEAGNRLAPARLVQLAELPENR